MIPKLSIVTAYINRRNSFINTLHSIAKSKYAKDIEVVVTDDGSDENNQIGDIGQMGFPFPIKLIVVDKEKKTWMNSCIAFNMAIKKSEGKYIIIQNPENYHVTDIVSHVVDNLQHEDYFTYKVFALTDEQSKNIDNTIATTPFESITLAGHPNGWYNHPIHRAGYYHFVSAIYSDVLKNDLNGFDERYANGWGFDDDELIIRINNRGLKKCIVDGHLALHQWHPSSVPINPNGHLRDLTFREGKIKANE